jgi:hypothetical protein
MMRCGVGVLEFWDYTLKELQLILRNYNQKEEDKLAYDLQIAYNEASMISQFVWITYNGKPIPSFKNVFPKLEERTLSPEEKAELEYKKNMFIKEQ